MQERPTGWASLCSAPSPSIHTAHCCQEASYKAGPSVPNSCVQPFSSSSCQQEKVLISAHSYQDFLSWNILGSFGIYFLPCPARYFFPSNLAFCIDGLLNLPFQAHCRQRLLCSASRRVSYSLPPLCPSALLPVPLPRGLLMICLHTCLPSAAPACVLPEDRHCPVLILCPRRPARRAAMRGWRLAFLSMLKQLALSCVPVTLRSFPLELYFRTGKHLRVSLPRGCHSKSQRGPLPAVMTPSSLVQSPACQRLWCPNTMQRRHLYIGS